MCMLSDPPEFYSSRHPVARKAHVCGECRRTIEPGEQYLRGFGVQDGYSYEGIQCAHCEKATSWLLRQCNGFVFEMVAEDLEEHAREGYSPLGLRRLVAQIKHQWKRKNGQLIPLEKVRVPA